MRRPFDEEFPEEITLPAQADSVPKLIDFAASHAREMAFDEKRIEQIGLALREALDNILRFSCSTGSEEIRISCEGNEMGSLLVTVVDTGAPFNMLVLSAFPEIAGVEAGSPEIPSTKTMKKYARDIEYRRDGDHKTNILVLTVLR
jgi:anti-sigma regulatory factor (Ser/Thr protein kinase)